MQLAKCHRPLSPTQARGFECRSPWTRWGLNPGSSACEANVIPLHHVPVADLRRQSRLCLQVCGPATFERSSRYALSAQSVERPLCSSVSRNCSTKAGLAAVALRPNSSAPISRGGSFGRAAGPRVDPGFRLLLSKGTRIPRSLHEGLRSPLATLTESLSFDLGICCGFQGGARVRGRQ